MSKFNAGDLVWRPDTGRYYLMVSPDKFLVIWSQTVGFKAPFMAFLDEDKKIPYHLSSNREAICELVFDKMIDPAGLKSALTALSTKDFLQGVQMELKKAFDSRVRVAKYPYPFSAATAPGNTPAAAVPSYTTQSPPPTPPPIPEDGDCNSDAYVPEEYETEKDEPIHPQCYDETEYDGKKVMDITRRLIR